MRLDMDTLKKERDLGVTSHKTTEGYDRKQDQRQIKALTREPRTSQVNAAKYVWW